MTQTTCLRCGSPLSPGARFCANCGFPVGEIPPPEERKVVTVIFVDLVGSTSLSAQIDPERYREVLAGFYRTVSEELDALRGQAYNFAGDAVVGVFGIPHTHDDDALRAVRAGLALAERIGRLGRSMSLPVPLRCRVGVNTGQVAIGTESAERGLLFGAVVNMAARLQQGAVPGTVLVGETTWLLTMDRVEFDGPLEVEAKGFEGVATAYRAVSLGPRSARRTIPFVDRRRELRLLRDAFERAVESRHAHMVTVIGEPGIGKSRVTEEFLSTLAEDAQVLVGRASPYEENATFAPLAQILLQRMGERPDSPSEDLRTRLKQMVADCCPEDEVDPVVARLGIALGLGEQAHAERHYRVAEIRSGLVALLGGLAVSGPVVLVFEDLQLANDPLLDLIEQVHREATTIPLVILCVARSELLDERPAWGGGLADSLNLYLEAMSLDDATELALQTAEGMDEATAERIARHAGGNPFFIVETTGMILHESGHLPSGSAALPEMLLPPTVQAVLGARIDHLPVEARDLIRKASVFARSTFDLSDLALIAEPDEKVLAMLEEEELLVRDEDRPDLWRFRHGLVRDVAYESLPKRERERLHVQVADGLAAEPRTAARYPRSIAFHLEQAARASLDLNPADRAIAERAVEALAHAGDLAMKASLARPSADLLERALALTGPERGWGTREAHIFATLGEARYWLGDFEAAVSPLERALELGGEDVGIRAHASRFLGDIELSIRGDRARAGELFDRALAAARELGDPWTLARTLLVAAWAPYWAGEPRTSETMFREALDVSRANPDGDPWAEARALVALATIEEEVGDDAESLALSEEALATSESAGDRFSIAVARESVGNALRRQWRLEEARPHLDVAVSSFRELGARWELASALTSRGNLLRLMGSLDAALKDLREAIRLCRELKERSIIDWTARSLALALVQNGDVKGAREVVEETARGLMAEETGSLEWLYEAELAILLAEDDREMALRRAKELVAFYQERALDKEVAQMVWWIGTVFGAEVAGGPDELARAKEVLERTHWLQPLREPALVVARS